MRLAAKKAALHLRARTVQSIRAFFISGGFIEIETPVLIPAPAPEAFIDAPKAEGGYLQTSPELAMKRLVSAGYGPIFQICRCFRAGERGARHLPEFTMLEWYRARADYTALMADVKNLFTHLSDSLGLGGKLSRGGREILINEPWEEYTVENAYLEFAGKSATRAIMDGDFDLVMADRIEPRLGLHKPAILKDYPASLAALARLKPEDPSVAERFEVYAGGLELANGFTELTDPAEQRARFETERAKRAGDGRDPYPMPEKFLSGLGAMPPTAGIALGIDRLMMLIANRVSIDEVVAFTPEEL